MQKLLRETGQAVPGEGQSQWCRRLVPGGFSIIALNKRGASLPLQSSVARIGKRVQRRSLCEGDITQVHG
jgi:hypothetical protein